MDKVFILLECTELYSYSNLYGDSPKDGESIVGVYDSYDDADVERIRLGEEAFRERKEDNTIAPRYYKVEEWKVTHNTNVETTKVGLKDCVECVNGDTFVLLKVKPDKEMDMIMTGLFEGNETMFRVTKGGDHVCTTWYKNGSTWSWHHGTSGYTMVADSVWNAWREIEKTIEQEFGISLK